jgi:hypothetical protein
MQRAVVALREKLGNDGMADLRVVIDDAGRQWKDDVLEITGERFERRLGAEIGAVRTDMGKEFAALRVDIAREFASVRVEMAQMQVRLLKWSFLFWIGQFAAVSGMMAFLLNTAGGR